jgi:hypothetical protein
MTDLFVMSMGGSHDTLWQTGPKCWCIRWPVALASEVDRPSGENFEQTLVRFAGLNRGLGPDQATTLLPNPGDMPDDLGAEQVPR